MTQVPFTEKHPVLILIPEPNVEVPVGEMLMVLAPVLPIDSNVPGVDVPIPRFEVKRLVLEAVVAKRLVDVALVVVPNVEEREEIVEEARTMMPPAPLGVMVVPVDVAHLELAASPLDVGHDVRQSEVRQIVVAESAVVLAYVNVEALVDDVAVT